MVEYLFNAAVKGVIEGFTEFIPISSTAHLILVNQWFPLTGDVAQQKALDQMFNIVIQFPAILAIFILFRQRLWASIRDVPARPEARNFWIGLIIAFIPAAILGKLFKDSIEAELQFALPIAIALIVGGLVLIVVESAIRTSKVESAEGVPFRTALLIGFFQCVAMIPGVSRSGATIVGARLLGLSRPAAAEFSFFLALPTMFAAFLYKGYKDFHTIDWQQHWPVIAVGCVTSFVTAWAVVAVFMRLINWKHSLTMWGVYRVALGGIILLTL
ncbi:MAG TPA: undecaprenyl-diphosphate phosphatase [Planctomycetota bacterium]|nr:undecaprenyl-diphosphate phosphatase [Planctomycetota bacterium]